FDMLRSTGVDLRLVIAPHEPTPPHVASVVDWARGSKLSLARLDHPTPSSADVVVIDRVGVLGDIYSIADLAYVGGGFHSAGLHSVLEPASCAAPLLFGARHDNSRDAALLEQRGGGISAVNPSDLVRRLRGWARTARARREAGSYARALVRSGVGAAERSFELVQRLLR